MAGITAAQIRAARAILTLKQSELAKSANISLATLNNIERDLGDPRNSTLNAIEQSLNKAGIDFKHESGELSIHLSLQYRPIFNESFQASQQILDYLRPHNLYKLKRILFYSYTLQNLDNTQPNSRCFAVLFEGKVRDILFDQTCLNMNSIAHIAEVSGIILACLIKHKKICYYLKNSPEDINGLELTAALKRLKEYPWIKMTSPIALISQLRNFNDVIQECQDLSHHPIFDLLRFCDIQIKPSLLYR